MALGAENSIKVGSGNFAEQGNLENGMGGQTLLFRITYIGED